MWLPIAMRRGRAGKMPPTTGSEQAALMWLTRPMPAATEFCHRHPWLNRSAAEQRLHRKRKAHAESAQTRLSVSVPHRGGWLLRCPISTGARQCRHHCRPGLAPPGPKASRVLHPYVPPGSAGAGTGLDCQNCSGLGMGNGRRTGHPRRPQAAPVPELRPACRVGNGPTIGDRGWKTALFHSRVSDVQTTRGPYNGVVMTTKEDPSS